MIWKKAIVYSMTATGDTDELGNAVKVKSEIWEGDARFTPWTVEEIQSNGKNLSNFGQSREVTKSEQMYALPVNYNTIQFAEQVELDGVLHDIISISELSPRWTLIQVRVYKI